MPEMLSRKCVLPLKVLAQQTILVQRAHSRDFYFFKSVATKPFTPEYGGFNTRMARMEGQAVKPATTAAYTPLIDMTPSDPTTMKTAMLEAKRLTEKVGQAVTIFTVDLQLYRVGLQVQWAYPEVFGKDFILRLGGMHFLMSFVGAIGNLMAGSGLEEIMRAAFGGVPKMLTGKNFPQNTRALRIVVEEILHDILSQVNTFDELMQELDVRSQKSKISKHWVENLIKPVLLVLMFIRAEREAEWTLHLWAVKQMIPYFFASGHIHYARYGLLYLREMEGLHGKTLAKFLRGEHVQRHRRGLWNGIWTDMFIETTFMRYGHGPGGLIGITLNEKAVHRWALSLHTCSRLIKDMKELKDLSDTDITTHKEEMGSRIKYDENDRKAIREKLSKCIDPMNAAAHPASLANIVTGRICPAEVNVQDAVTLGKAQQTEYEASWPQGFQQPLKKAVVTMKEAKKKPRTGPSEQFESGLIFARGLALMNSREINVKELMSHELAHVPTSMFEEETGEMRVAKSKSVLKTKLKVEESTRKIGLADAIVIDGCALLWVVHWPAKGTVKDFVLNYIKYVTGKLKGNCRVHVIFDRYLEYSAKSGTRCSRATPVSREHQLSLNSPLPPQQIVLTVTKNKIQLIDMICDMLTSTVKGLGNPNSLVITGKSPVPVEVSNGLIIPRHDLKTLHEEADIIIPQQVVYLSGIGCQNIRVISDDTDVFVLLTHYYLEMNLTAILLMEPTSQGRSVINISETVSKHLNIVPQLLSAHALSGCDTVAGYFGIGKAKVLKVLEAGYELQHLGNISADLKDVFCEATNFVAACYGQKCQPGETMSDIRYKVWAAKTGRKGVCLLPKLKSLPPTLESFRENTKRAHFQACIWKAALSEGPPCLDPEKFGWEKDHLQKFLCAIPLPQDAKVAPAEVLKLIQCSCGSSQCSSSKCSCAGAQVACSTFCKCGASEICNNLRTKQVLRNDDVEDTDEVMDNIETNYEDSVDEDELDDSQ